MFMRIAWGRVKPGQWDEYERRYAEVLASPQGPAPKHRWLVQDLEDPDAGYSISLWENETDMRTYSSDPEIRAQVEKTFGDLFTGQYETRLCRVQRTS